MWFGMCRSLSLYTPVMVLGAPTIGPAFNEPLVECAWTIARKRELGAGGCSHCCDRRKDTEKWGRMSATRGAGMQKPR
jgi:hypothetical protein